MMEAARTSETSVDNYFTRQYILEDNSELHTRRREYLKSQCNNMFKDFFSLFLWFSIKTFLTSPTVRSASRYCFGLRMKGGSESKACRPEFLSSEVGNPSL
jgi:hypothetical protein